MNITIFDFDQTLTKEHSFRSFCVEQFSHPRGAHYGKDPYQVGKTMGPSLVKTGIDKVVKHDGENISAIATYHNNPAFVAGVISSLLGKDLRLKGCVADPAMTATAIAQYEIEGIEAVFCVSFIQHQQDDYQVAKGMLESNGGKNIQIIQLQVTLAIPRGTPITFYDDDPVNVAHAKKLPNVHSYRVSASSGLFTIMNELSTGFSSFFAAKEPALPTVTTSADEAAAAAPKPDESADDEVFDPPSCLL